MRVLEAAVKEVDNSLVESTHGGLGYRVVMRCDRGVCDDGPDTYARAARFAIEAGSLHWKSVAWIGGGLCVGPAVFAAAGCRQTVYEIEPALAEFCPRGVTFVAGDWRDNITGTFDVIVYDLGGDVPRETLEKHLAVGGLILPYTIDGGDVSSAL